MSLINAHKDIVFTKVREFFFFLIETVVLVSLLFIQNVWSHFTLKKILRVNRLYFPSKFPLGQRT